MRPRKLLQRALAILLCVSGLIPSAFAQSKIITGKVTDSKDGAPVMGASVIPKGTKGIGATTNAQGEFRITVPAKTDALVISSVGYDALEVPISGKTTVEVSLNATNTALNEVVVIGYGTQKKKELTGSIATVGSKDFQQGAITSAGQLIAGKVAGVTITSNSGQPGSGTTIQIRGGASLNASNEPLIVIDGVPLAYSKNQSGKPALSGASDPLSLINPNDIESFTVLKDAASTAIYGSRASNGVILITTKKGRSGKPVFNFSTQFSAGHVTKEIPVMSAGQFRNTVDTLARYHPEKVTTGDTALLGDANTDWQKEIYQTALSTDNNLGISGSFPGIKMPYRLSLGFLDQQGILITDKYQRSSASLRVNPVLFDNHLKVDINLNGSIARSRFANQGAIGAAVAFDPTQPVYDAKHKFGGYFEWLQSNDSTPNPNATRNPVALLKQKYDKGEVDRSFGNIQLDYKVHFLPDLHANLNLGYDIARGHGTVETPADAAQAYNDKPSLRGTNNKYQQRVLNTTAEFYLNYVKDIKSIKSNINATAGYGYYNFLTTNYNYASFSASGDTIPGSAQVNLYDRPEYTLLSYYGRLIYTFDNRYILAASLRTDGSSKFGPSYRWGTFPSIAFTWRINDEDFLRNSSLLSDLKFRVSYGVTGQQDGIPYYQYLPTYYQGQNTSQYQLGNTFYYTYSPSAYVSDLKWEQTAASDVGLDYGFLNNRIYGAIDYYYKKTKNLLSTVNIPVGSNFTNLITTNVGNMEDKGFEFSVNAVPVRNDRLNWDFGFNIAYNKFTITNLSLPGVKDPGNVQTGSISGATGQNIQIQTVGFSPYSFYVFHQVYDQNGKPVEGLYADVNRDGVINDQDRYQYKSPYPRVTMGFSTELTYLKWSFSTVLRANIDNYMYNNVVSNLAVARNILNPGTFLENAPSAYYKTQFYNNQYQSDYYIENASFLRMDNLGVAYNAGRIWDNKVDLRLNLNCQNVFIITKYTGVDPEINGGIDNNFYPRPRTFTLGANLRF